MQPASSPLSSPDGPDLAEGLRRRAQRVPGSPHATSILQLIGRTPVVEFQNLPPLEGRAALMAKLEFRNPGGSVKDRIALAMVLDAEERGVLTPPGLIVEPTAGNTGIGLALVGRQLGHAVTLVMPQRYCAEKRRVCRALGAEVIEVPGDAVGMQECIELAREVAEDRGGVVLDQFVNPVNVAVHQGTTGPEFFEQLRGEVDALVLGVGSGGTFTGVVRALRRHRPDLPAFAVENQASVLGGRRPIPSRVEGIGSSFVPETLDLSLATEVLRVRDDDAFAMARELALHEGILAGASGGAIVHAALDVARTLGPGRRVATLVPDLGERYWSKGLYEDP